MTIVNYDDPKQAVRMPHISRAARKRTWIRAPAFISQRDTQKRFV
jgi:hypothetical protein